MNAEFHQWLYPPKTPEKPKHRTAQERDRLIREAALCGNHRSIRALACDAGVGYGAVRDLLKREPETKEAYLRNKGDLW